MSTFRVSRRLFSRFNIHGLAACLALAALLRVTSQARAQTLVWGEEFNAAFSHTWVTTPGLPEPTVVGNPVQYLGAPTTAFQTVDGQGVLRMTRALTTLQRVGFHTSETFPLTDGYVELRVNTLTQDAMHIDGLAELWLIDAADNTNFVRVCLFGSFTSNFRTFQAESSGGAYVENPFDYTNDTWYRLRLRFAPGVVVAEVRSDDDQTLLDSVEYEHDLTTPGSAYQIGVAQWAAFPPGDTVEDSAVDYVRLYATCVEGPSVTIEPHPNVACPGQTTEFHATTHVGTLGEVKWRRNNIDIDLNDTHYTATSAGDNHTLLIDPIRPVDSGTYTLYALGACGSAVSEDSPMTVFASATGDVNEDGVTNGRDIQAFAKLLVNGGFLVPGYCAADMDSSGFVDINDIPQFVARLTQ